MKRIFIAIFLLIFIAGCEKDEFQVPALTGRVVDTAKVLSQKDKDRIENAILNFEKNTKGQFAVCIIPSLKNESIESASIKIAEKWKIGNKDKDDGIIFVLAMKERDFRIEVGYGYEGKINDARAGDLGRKAIPEFKNKKWSNGIVIIINGCSDIIAGKKQNVNFKDKDENTDKNFWLRIAITVVCIILIFIFVCNNHDECFISTGGGGYRGGGSSGSGFGGHGGGFGGGGFSGKF